MIKLDELLKKEGVTKYRLCKTLGPPFVDSKGNPQYNSLKGYGKTFCKTYQILEGLQRITGNNYNVIIE